MFIWSTWATGLISWSLASGVHPMPTVSIVLDEPVCYAGSSLNGAVRIVLRQPHEMYGLNLNLHGTQEVKITEVQTYTTTHTAPVSTYNPHTGRVETRIQYYTTTHERFIPHKHTATLLDVNTQVPSAPQILPPGDHMIRFSIAIPYGTPASHGRKVISLRDSGYNEYVLSASLRLNGVIFSARTHCLIHDPIRTSLPIVINQIHNLEGACCCFTKGYFDIRVRMAKNTFCIGESVPIDLSIDCSSSPNEMKKSTIELVQVIRYASGTFSKSKHVVLNTVSIPRIKERSKMDSSFIIQVPQNVEFGTNSHGIQVSHMLRFTIKDNWTAGCIFGPTVQLIYPASSMPPQYETVAPSSPVSVAAVGSPKFFPPPSPAPPATTATPPPSPLISEKSLR